MTYNAPRAGKGLNPFVFESQPDLWCLFCPRTLSAGARVQQNGDQGSVLESQPDFVSANAPYLLLPLLQENEDQGCGLAIHLAIYLPTCLSTCLPVCYLHSVQSGDHASVKGVGHDSTTSAPQFCLFHPDTGKR